jgi:alpha-glucosidase (family GH31 glycosyl hydrolase)
MDVSRRNAIVGMAAGSLQLLLCRRLPAVGPAGETGQAGALDLMLTALSPQTLRISIAPVNETPKLSELGVLDRPEPQPLYANGRVRNESLTWGKFRIAVSADPLHISVFDGDKLRQEIRFAPDSTNVQFNIDGPIFGLGEGVQSFDLRNTRDPMLNGENVPGLRTFGARLPIPWVISPHGWGIFIGQPQGSFSFTQTEGTFLGTEATSTRNVYLLLGNTPAEVLSEYADLTGHPHLPPLWSLGYQQSHRTLASKEEIISIAKTFRDKKLPCDAVIYLGTGFCPSGWNTGHGSFTFNAQVFPDPPAVLRQLHDENLKVIVHIVPPGNFHGTLKDIGAEAKEPGDAVPYWQQHLPLVQAGVDGWWPDEGDRLSVYARLQRNQMYWDGSRQASPAKRPFALHRNGYAGLQRYGWLWSGDTMSTWDSLKAQILVGISTGLCGIPYWGSDTGGFVPTPEFTPELFIRWFQFSSFCPSFRSHGRAWKLHLPWGWGTGDPGPKEVEGAWVDAWPPPADLRRADVEEICRKYLDLRYQLLPYNYSTAADAHRTGMPMIRSLWLLYGGEERTHLIDDCFLWGDAFLVAPVHTKGAAERTVYLPRGLWFDYWTGERLNGGGDINAKAELGTLPLYVKAGAIVPVGPAKQFANENSEEPPVLRIFPGANGQFRWYEDDGESFAYERGQFMAVDCEWDDQRRLLTLRRDPAGVIGEGRPVRVEVFGTNLARMLTVPKTASTVQL